MFQTYFMFLRDLHYDHVFFIFSITCWPAIIISSFLDLKRKKIQIIIHNPIWNITWTWGSLVRANAEGEFQGLVLRSNQEQSFFFKKETWEPDNGKKLSLSLVRAKNLVRERDFFQDKKMSKYVFKSRTWCLGDFQTPPVQTSMRSPRLTRRASGWSGRRGIGVQDPFNLACSPFVLLRHKKVKLL